MLAFASAEKNRYKLIMAERYFAKFGQVLKEARVAAHLSQTTAASALNYDQQLLSHWERGLSAPPVRILRKIAKLYDIQVDDLYALLMEDSLRRTRLRLEEQIRKSAR